MLYWSFLFNLQAEYEGTESEVTSTSQSDITYMENEDAYQYI